MTAAPLAAGCPDRPEPDPAPDGEEAEVQRGCVDGRRDDVNREEAREKARIPEGATSGREQGHEPRVVA